MVVLVQSSLALAKNNSVAFKGALRFQLAQTKRKLEFLSLDILEFIRKNPVVCSALLLNEAILSVVLSFLMVALSKTASVAGVGAVSKNQGDKNQMPDYFIDLKNRVRQAKDKDLWRIIGRGNEREEIIQKVASPRGMTSLVIVGKAGVGKTTVAR